MKSGADLVMLTATLRVAFVSSSFLPPLLPDSHSGTDVNVSSLLLRGSRSGGSESVDASRLYMLLVSHGCDFACKKTKATTSAAALIISG